jgi:hypothetical protein
MIPKKKLIPQYKENFNNSLFCKSKKASLENDENVVNPPQTPTVKKRRHSDDIIAPFSKIPEKIPIRKHPTMLMINVPQGNTVSK